MRGIAALYVVLGHFFTLIDPYAYLLREAAAPLWLSYLSRPFWYGHLAVAAFIIISGFCLQLSLYNRGDGRLIDVKRFLKRRSWRILPPYYACLALSLIVAIFVTQRQVHFIALSPSKLAANPDILPWSQYLPVTWENTFAHVLMLQNFDPSWMYKINGVLWSISIEFQLYFLFPFFVWLLFRRGPLALLAPTVAITIILLALWPLAGKLYIWYMPLFVAGMVAARICFGKPSENGVWTKALQDNRLLLSIAVGAIISTCLVAPSTKALWQSDCIFGVAVVCLLILGSHSPQGFSTKLFSAKAVVWLGTFSYSLYLMHHPILQTLYAFRPAQISSMAESMAYVLFAGLPAILGVSYAFYWVFERPFVRGRPGRGRKSDPPIPGF